MQPQAALRGVASNVQQGEVLLVGGQVYYLYITLNQCKVWMEAIVSLLHFKRVRYDLKKGWGVHSFVFHDITWIIIIIIINSRRLVHDIVHTRDIMNIKRTSLW